VELEWKSRGTVMVQTRGKTLRVAGEALLERDPDFLIYPQYMTHWEDGSELGDDEKDEILREVIEAAAGRGWKFAIEEP
jgi:hypothetical protein